MIFTLLDLQLLFLWRRGSRAQFSGTFAQSH